MQEIRFGVIQNPTLPWNELIECWKKVEELRFDSLWTGDHFCNYSQPTQSWFEGWTTVTGMAHVTEYIRIGPLVTTISLRHPAMLARQALTVDHISKGRLNLGIGGGAPSFEGETVYEMIGIDDWTPGERVAHFKEQVEIISQLLREGVSSYSGKFYTLKDVGMFPRPIQNPLPLTLGGIRPKMLRIAAKFADTWNSYGGIRLNPEEMYESVKKQSETIDDYCKELNRDSSTLRKSILIYGEEAETIYDKEDNFIKYFEKYRELGFTEFILYYPWFEEQVRIFSKLANEILPDLKS